MLIALHGLNERVVYVYEQSMIAQISPERTKKFKIPLISCNVFKYEAYSNVKVGRKSVAKEWMDWEGRRTVNNIVYAPNEPRFTKDGNLNSWFPPPSTPKAGDLTLFHYYMSEMMASDSKYLPWVTAWIAHHIQNPEKKILSSVIFWSHEQGNGKSTLGWILRKLFGMHNSSLVINAFPERFNSYAENVLLIFVDELKPVRKSDRIDFIKSMVTQPTVLIENKQEKAHEIPDLSSLYFTSNHPNALDLGPEDRRFFVHNVGRNNLTQEWFKKTFRPWLETQEAIDAIHDYFLNIDLTLPIIGGIPDSLEPAPFSYTQIAPRNDARRQMIADNRDDIESWLHELVESPENVLLNSNEHWTIFSSEELFKLYREQTDDKKLGIQAFRIRMSGVLAKLCKGQPLRIDGFETTRPRLYTTDPAKANFDMTQIKEIVAQERGMAQNQTETCAKVCVN